MGMRLSQTVLGLVLVLALAAAVATPALADDPAPAKSAARFEVKFMQDMIDHHMMAIMEAELCVEKAVHEELRQLCENIIATQSMEMMMMQEWLQEWYGISYEPMMTNGMMRQIEKLSKLEGAEFEVAFMEGMIRHHRMAVMEGEKCLDRAYHTELLELCQNIIDTQTQEIGTMQTWLCEWYGECKASWEM